ncbi:MAG TPA: protease SohB [Pseudomonadales bacterium]|nr:protease SohB [Pseudomonadales bacterium]
MTEFLTDYGLFLAKAVTVVFAVLVIISMGVAASMKNRRPEKGEIKVKYLNDEFEEMEFILKETVLTKEQWKAEEKALKKKEKEEEKARKEGREKIKRRIYVLNFDGDEHASQTESFAKEVSAVLTMATPQDEVVVRLESPGGIVHEYGYAASLIDRFVRANIPLLVCVDKVAASGGYLMACVANRILAAPFAIVGSVGVVASVPNFNRLLKKNDVDYSIYTAGQYKRTVTMLGEITEEGKKKFQEELEDTHVLFKNFVSTHRKVVDIDRIATGEYWYGERAKELKLVDEIMTSDEYLFAARNDADIFEVTYEIKKNIAEKFGFAMQASLEAVWLKIWRQIIRPSNNIH